MHFRTDDVSAANSPEEAEALTQHVPLTGRVTAAVLAFIACSSMLLLCLTDYYVENVDLMTAIWVRFGEMAVVGNLLVMISFTIVAVTGRLTTTNHLALASHLTALVVMSLIYHFYYANEAGFAFSEIAGYQLIHTLLVLLLLLWWAAFASIREVEFLDIPALGLWPAIYLAYYMWRGSIDGTYFYPFLDPTLLGRDIVWIAMLILVTGYCVIAALIVILTRFLAR